MSSSEFLKNQTNQMNEYFTRPRGIPHTVVIALKYNIKYIRYSLSISWALFIRIIIIITTVDYLTDWKGEIGSPAFHNIYIFRRVSR